MTPRYLDFRTCIRRGRLTIWLSVSAKPSGGTIKYAWATKERDEVSNLVETFDVIPLAFDSDSMILSKLTKAERAILESWIDTIILVYRPDEEEG